MSRSGNIKQAQDDSDKYGLPSLPQDNSVTLPDINITGPAHKAPSRGFEVVKEMQQAIINFSNTLAKNFLMSMEKDQQGKMRASQPGEQGGSNAFGDFLVNQYINKSSEQGKQYVNVDQAEPVRSGAGAIENVNLRGVINTIGHIGTPGSENKPDGIWKTRTNNALKQILAVASALVNLQQDLRVPSKTYTQKDLQKLQENIPESYTDLKGPIDITKRAQNIVSNLAQLTIYYKELEGMILNNEKYKPFIDQDKPLHQVQEKAAPFTKNESDFFRTNNQKQIPNISFQYNGAQFPLTYANISSLPEFQKFLVDNKIQLTDNKAMNEALNNLEKQIDAQISQPSGNATHA